MQDHNLKETLKNWRVMIKDYQKPNTKKAIIQLLNSFVPFIALWVLMYFSLNWSYLITIGLAAVTAFFLVRIFIVQHDCGHQSFLKSRKWNNAIGFVASFFSTIPYQYWGRSHSHHHAHNGQLEHRGMGDIFYLTTEEYSNRSKWGKIRYRIFRHPIVQFMISPIVYLTVSLRYPFLKLKGWKKIRRSHIINNLLLVLVYGGLALAIGWKQLILIHVPILLIFGVIAFWFFYVQHQHDENYNESQDQWDHLLASIRGSTFYKLPKLFHWLTGNIGYHHIHHLSSRIPNYHLEACSRENPILNKYVTTITFRESLKFMQHKLWDGQQQRMITFKEFEKNY